MKTFVRCTFTGDSLQPTYPCSSSLTTPIAIDIGSTFSLRDPPGRSHSFHSRQGSSDTSLGKQRNKARALDYASNYPGYRFLDARRDDLGDCTAWRQYGSVLDLMSGVHLLSANEHSAVRNLPRYRYFEDTWGR